jgi:pimeloyl-ACP methyl ester carboxylesterase
MKRFYASFSFILLMLALAGTSLPVSPAIAQTGYESLSLEIDLGDDFVTQAELTYPAVGDAPFPTIILFHGSGPYDMDASYAPLPGDEPVSTNFRLIAETLPAQGIAVLRFNKRGVLGYGEYDMAQVQRSSNLDQLVADANAVVEAALAQEQVGALYLYGWSEGAWVAANVAAERDDINGLILQGVPEGDLSGVIRYQHLENALPYLAETIDADGDGALTLAEVGTIPQGYPVSLMPQFYLYDFASTPEAPLLNTFVNRDGDDAIDIEGELRPAIEQFLASFPSFIANVESSYDTSALIAESGLPTLLLHGTLDGWTPLAGAQSIADANPDSVTLLTYEGLGHALSPVESVVFDTFGVMEAQVIVDVADWVKGE